MPSSTAPRATPVVMVGDRKLVGILLVGMLLVTSLAVVRPAAASTASISASPSSGSPGTSVTIVASGFPTRAGGEVEFSGVKVA